MFCMQCMNLGISPVTSFSGVKSFTLAVHAECDGRGVHGAPDRARATARGVRHRAGARVHQPAARLLCAGAAVAGAVPAAGAEAPLCWWCVFYFMFPLPS